MTKEELSKTFEGFMIEELWADVHNKTITGHLRAAERSAEFVLNLLSSESKLTAEAGGGERGAVAELRGALVEALAEIEYQHQDMLSEEERNHPRGSGWARVYDKASAAIKRIDNVYTTTPPLTTKGEQNAATKEEGVEEQEEFELYATAKAFMVNNPDEEDYIQQNFRQFMGFDGPGDNSIQSSDRWQMNKRIVDKYEAANPVHSSAPDKGEELLQKADKITGDAKAKLDVKLQQIIDRDYSVGKSEGEEAVMRELIKKHLEGWNSLAKRSIEYYAESGHVSGSLFLAIKEMLKEYARSSGDRGRKEWPGEQEIINESFRAVTPNGRQTTVNDRRGYFRDGATWAINWLKSRIEGEEREEA